MTRAGCFRRHSASSRPGGRFAVSDVVVRGDTPEAVRQEMELWMGCVAGALEEQEYRTLLDDAGFEQIEVEVRVCMPPMMPRHYGRIWAGRREFAREIDGKSSARSCAMKPLTPRRASCCNGPDCTGLPCCDDGPSSMQSAIGRVATMSNNDRCTRSALRVASTATFGDRAAAQRRAGCPPPESPKRCAASSSPRASLIAHRGGHRARALLR